MRFGAEEGHKLTKINDQILQELGKDLGTTKIPPVANLVDALMPTIDTELYRRKLFVASDALTPGGVSATDFTVEYASPESNGIEWFAASFSNASQQLIMFLSAQTDSAKGLKTVSVGRIILDIASAKTLFIGAADVQVLEPVDDTFNQWIPKTVYVPAGNKLQMTVGTKGGGTLANNALDWTLFGWSVPKPRGETLVIPFVTAPVAP